MYYAKEKLEEVIKILKNGGIGVMPTDTIYGVVASVWNEKSVEKIFEIKNRDRKKALIVLISEIKDLEIFGVKIDLKTKSFLQKIWPGPVSVIFPVSSKWSYIDRGIGKIAFRLPSLEWLREFIKMSGPIVAPSANSEGEKPAENIIEAQKYFGNKVDFYLDGGNLKGEPSSVVEFVNGEVEVVRGREELLFKKTFAG